MEKRWLSISALNAAVGKPPTMGMFTASRAASTPHMSKSLSQMPSKPSRSSCSAVSTTARPLASQSMRSWMWLVPRGRLRASTSTSAGITGRMDSGSAD